MPKELVSCLRFEHKLDTAVRHLTACDYIVSTRMAVERKVLSGRCEKYMRHIVVPVLLECWQCCIARDGSNADFTTGAQKAKLVDRIRQLCELFDRPCLIVEKDRVKPGEEKATATKLL